MLCQKKTKKINKKSVPPFQTAGTKKNNKKKTSNHISL